MSIRLFDSVMWRDADVFDVAPKVRSCITDVRIEMYTRLLVACTLDRAVHHARQGTSNGFGALDADRELTNAIRAAEAGVHRSPLDLACEVMFLSRGDGHLYGVVFAERREFHRAVAEMSEPYGWWNNTDRPDEVTEHDWEERRAVWADLLDNFNASPASRGVSVRVDSTSMVGVSAIAALPAPYGTSETFAGLLADQIARHKDPVARQLDVDVIIRGAKAGPRPTS